MGMKKVSDKNELKRQMITQIEEQLKEIKDVDILLENAEHDMEECPVCKSKNIDVIQRITGYLVGSVNNWNSAKKAELRDRVTHGI